MLNDAPSLDLVPWAGSYQRTAGTLHCRAMSTLPSILEVTQFAHYEVLVAQVHSFYFWGGPALEAMLLKIIVNEIKGCYAC